MTEKVTGIDRIIRRMISLETARRSSRTTSWSINSTPWIQSWKPYAQISKTDWALPMVWKFVGLLLLGRLGSAPICQLIRSMVAEEESNPLLTRSKLCCAQHSNCSLTRNDADWPASGHSLVNVRNDSYTHVWRYQKLYHKGCIIDWLGRRLQKTDRGVHITEEAGGGRMAEHSSRK